MKRMNVLKIYEIDYILENRLSAFLGEWFQMKDSILRITDCQEMTAFC